MEAKANEVLAVLLGEFANIDFAPGPLMPGTKDGRAQFCVTVSPDRLLEVMRFLHDDARCRFEQVADLTCVDYSEFPEARDRYGVVYTLVSVSRGQRIWVKCYANDPSPEVPSVTGIWKGADWPEREVFDLFGVRFTGHPDLRRIMTWDGFEAHPLRKDYPLRGCGEREEFEVVKRDGA